MDTLLQNGDFALDRCGLPQVATHHQELLQRAVLCLQVRRGSFAPDPSLGSRLYRLPRAESAMLENLAQSAVEEALASLPYLRVEAVGCRYDSDKDRVNVVVRLGLDEAAYTLEVNI